MHVRAVRFTDVSPEKVDMILDRVDGEGPPEGAPVTQMQLLHDEEQRTAVVLQFYDSAEDMERGDAVFAAMDAGETPGARASVDRCVMKVNVHA
jgi:hypothetical protein